MIWLPDTTSGHGGHGSADPLRRWPPSPPGVGQLTTAEIEARAGRFLRRWRQPGTTSTTKGMVGVAEVVTPGGVVVNMVACRHDGSEHWHLCES